MNKQSVKIRGKEIAQRATDSGGRMTLEQIAEEVMADMTPAETEQFAKDLIKQMVTTVLPKPDLPTPNMDALFEYHGFVVIPTDEGLMVAPGDSLTCDEAESVMVSKNQHDKQQAYRSSAALKDIRRVKEWEGFDPSLTYNENSRACTLALRSLGPADGGVRP